MRVSPSDRRRGGPREAAASPTGDPRPQPPAAPPALRVVLVAGERLERTRRTLASLLAHSPPSVTALILGATEHPWASRRLGARVRFSSAELDPAGLAHALAPGERLVLVEDGALVPARWAQLVEAHLAAEPSIACLVATTNHAPGPERLDPSAAGAVLHRVHPGRWQAIASAAAERWPAQREDVESACSPLFVLPDPGCVEAVASGPQASEQGASGPRPALPQPPALVLPSAGRLTIARDLVVWREPRRRGSGAGFLTARVSQPWTEHATEQRTARASSAAVSAAELAARLSGLDPREHPGAHRALADAKVRLGDYRSAAASALACLASWPSHLGAKLILAQARARGGELARARATLAELQGELPPADPRKAHLLACAGELWRLEGDGRQAEQCLDAALATDPRQPLALDSRGLLSLEAGDFEAALRSFRAAVRSDPYFAAGWSDYGRALAMAGQHERARSALAKALSLRPGDREARRLLVRIAPGARRE